MSDTEAPNPFQSGSSRQSSACKHKFCPDTGLLSAAGMATNANAMILRMMLRPLALLMTAGSAAWILRDLILPPPELRPLCVTVTLVMGGVAAVLFSARDLSLKQLRGLEAVLFGSLGLYLFVFNYDRMVTDAASGDAALMLATWSMTVLGFVLLMGSYAIFVPTTWGRAARLVLPMAIAPVLLPFVVRGLQPAAWTVAAPAFSVAQVTDRVFVLVIAAAVSIVGTAVINRYRAAAFEAREANLYDLRERIGAGGMGEVWLAHHQTLARPAAIKIVRPELLGEAEGDSARIALRRFEREAQATAGLRSPNTVEIYDFGVTQEGVFYYVMEYLDGLDLDTLVKQHGPLPAARAIHLVRQACSSLADAHANGLVHRDVKPANIFACRLGQEHDFVKVLDFGLVKEQRASGQTQLTVEGLTTGTPAYLPPEMAMQTAPIGPAADIYALGCVTYWLLTGKLVFDQPTPMAMVVDHVKAEPVAPSTRTELPVSPELDAIVLKCLQKDPAHRYASMRELSDALAAVPLVTEPWGARDSEEWWALHQPARSLADLARAS